MMLKPYYIVIRQVNDYLGGRGGTSILKGLGGNIGVGEFNSGFTITAVSADREVSIIFGGIGGGVLVKLSWLQSMSTFTGSLPNVKEAL